MTEETDKTPQLKCSFCGKTQNEVSKLIAGKNVLDAQGQEHTVFICNECIDLCADIIKEQKEPLDFSELTLKKPAEIFETLNQYVIGQERAKKTLSVAVYNHYKRLNSLDKKAEVEIEKSNILLLDPQDVVKHCWHGLWREFWTFRLRWRTQRL